MTGEECVVLSCQEFDEEIIAVTHSVTRGPARLRSTPLKSQSSPGNSSGLGKNRERERRREREEEERKRE